MLYNTHQTILTNRNVGPLSELVLSIVVCSRNCVSQRITREENRPNNRIIAMLDAHSKVGAKGAREQQLFEFILSFQKKLKNVNECSSLGMSMTIK